MRPQHLHEQYARDDERRSLQVQWTDDAQALRRRAEALVAFLERLNPAGEAAAQAKVLLSQLSDGRFATLQAATRLYATYGKDAEAKFDGRAEKEIESMKKETAELLAKEGGLTREMQDAFALRSHQRAQASRDKLAEEIVPVEVKDRKTGTRVIERDEHPRADATLESLGVAKPFVLPQ